MGPELEAVAVMVAVMLVAAFVGFVIQAWWFDDG